MPPSLRSTPSSPSFAGFARAAAVLLTLNAGGSVSGQPDGGEARVSDFGARYDAFRLVLQEVAGPGLELRRLDELAEVEPEDQKRWIVVILGQPVPPPPPPGGWSDFLASGGSLLIATDEATDPLLPVWPVRVAPGPVVAPIGARYLNRPHCPLVVGLKPGDPLFDKVRWLALNRSGHLEGIDRSSGAIAWLPRGSEIAGEELTPPPPFLATRYVGAGRAAVLADQSLLVNEMILEQDNLVFARNLARWLGADRDPRSLSVVWIENGVEQSEWLDPRFLSGDWTPPSGAKLLAVLNELLTGLEDEDAFNKFARWQSDRWNVQSLRRWSLLLPTALLGLTLCWWLARSRRKESRDPDPGRSPLPLGSGVDARVAEIVAQGDYFEPARLLARSALERLGEPGDDDLGWFVRRRRARRVNRLRALANAAAAVPVGRREFDQLRLDAAELLLRTDGNEG